MLRITYTSLQLHRYLQPRRMSHNCPVEESNKKIHEMAETAKDKVCEGGKAVKEAAESGVKKVQETGKNAYGATAEKLGEARDYIGDKLHGGADAVKGK